MNNDSRPSYRQRGQYEPARRPGLSGDDMRRRLARKEVTSTQTTPERQPILSPEQAVVDAPIVTSRVQRLLETSKLPKLPWEQVAVVACAILFVGGGAYGAFTFVKSRQPIPQNIKRQLSYGIFYPSDKSVLAASKASFAYDSKTTVLSFSAKRPSGVKISFSEQPTPGSIVDIPQVYDKLVDSLQPYNTFDSVNGKVALTHPNNLNGGQTAVMNDKGTLIFVRPTKDLTDTEWRQVFNSLSILR